MEKLIQLNTNKKKAYRQYLAILSLFPPLNTLRNKELDLLALLMYNWNEYSDNNLKDSDIRTLLFSTTKRKEMADELSLNTFGFTTLLYELRKKKLVLEDDINSNLKVKLDSVVKLVIQLNII